MPRTKTTVRFPRKAEFSILDIININPTLSSPTIRKHVALAVGDGILADTGKRRRTGSRGRPAFLFTRAN